MSDIDTTTRAVLILEEEQTYRRGSGLVVTHVTRAAWLPEMFVLVLEHKAGTRGERDVSRSAARVEVVAHSDAVRAAVKAADAWGEEIRQKWPPAE